MDSIDPISPGSSPIPRGGLPPVKRLERITRERDRPSQEEREAQRRDPAYKRTARVEEHDDDDGRPHVDVHA
jgi:hypothetical protein